MRMETPFPWEFTKSSALISGSQAEHERILVAITIGTYNVPEGHLWRAPDAPNAPHPDGGELQRWILLQ